MGTYDGRITRIYMNGKLNETKTVTLDTGNSKLAIGGGNFGGVIDDVRVYNRALSDSEIRELYKTI